MANSAGVRFDALLSLMARLRGEGGCPWDREQTRASLKPYLIEEAYEVLHAIDEDDTGHLAEELGDLLFQVVFHCQIAGETGEFTMSDVLDRLIEKMTRRHPHVFGDRTVTDARDALRQWEQIKRDEGDKDGAAALRPRRRSPEPPRAPPRSATSSQGRPRGLRLANLAPGVGRRCARRSAEMDEALDRGDDGRIRHELGDVLFSVVNVARLLGRRRRGLPAPGGRQVHPPIQRGGDRHEGPGPDGQ